MKTLSPTFFAKLARDLIVKGDHADVARRYLQNDRRIKVLRDGAALAKSESKRDNPLAEIKFRPPLSLAGCGSLIIVRGEKMLLDGIPVSLHRDDKGRHRGTPLDDVIDELHAETLTQYTEIQVCEFYRSFMSGETLSAHSDVTFRKIPKLLERAEFLRVSLEEKIQEIVLLGYDDFVFSVSVDSDSLAAILETAGPSVVIGCAGRECRVDSEPVVTFKVSGRGLSVVETRDLQSLLSPGAIIGIECTLSEWYGTSDAPTTALVKPIKRTFKYHGVEQ